MNPTLRARAVSIITEHRANCNCDNAHGLCEWLVPSIEAALQQVRREAMLEAAEIVYQESHSKQGDFKSCYDAIRQKLGE